MPKMKPTPMDDVPLMRPGLTIEARENQLIALATDLAERRLRNGTASAQEVTHFLKLGSSIAQLERKKLEEENKLLIAKTEALQAQKRTDEMYIKALEAMKRYGGYGDNDEDVEDLFRASDY